MKYFNRFLALAIFIATSVCIYAKTPDRPLSPLKVNGATLVDNTNTPVQLRGVSFGWHNLWPRFYRPASVKRLHEDWGADVVRCSIGLDLDDKTYDKDPAMAYACIDSIVSGAVDAGIYVIVDFHSHANNLALAKEFFTHVGKKYGHLPNLIYEIWNEPTEVPWTETKAYAEELIPLIRKYSPDNIIIVPTPRWDQEIDKAADDPIVGQHNIMYSLHYYAASHKDDLRRKAKYAIEKGLPVFMSECAAMEYTGDGVISTSSWEEWMDLADENNISWVAWSLSDKDETCSMLRPSASSDAGLWTKDDLKPWAVLVRYYINRNRN